MVKALLPIEGPRCHSYGIRGWGNPNADVVLVGIAPGKDEVRSGRPFTGASGKVLDAILDACGYPRDKVYCTNVICWWKDKPEPEEIIQCYPRLMDELRSIRPKLVVALGEIATQTLLGKASGVRGQVLYQPHHGWYFMSTYHPAAIFRQGSFVVDIVRDLDKVRNIMGWPLSPTGIGRLKYCVVTEPEEAQRVLDDLPRDGTLVTLDVENTIPYDDDKDETTPYGAELLCLAITLNDLTWVFTESALEGLQWSRDVWWGFHGGQHDVQVLRKKYNTILPICEDSMLMSYALDERPGYHKLKPLSREYLGVGFYEVQSKARKGKRPLTPEEWYALWEYNGWDSCNTGDLIVDEFAPRLHDDNVYDYYRNYLLPAANTFADIQYRGVRVDRAKLAELAADWAPRWIASEQRLKDMAAEAGIPGKYNPNSPAQLSKLLFQVLGLPGGPSTKRAVIEGLVGMHPYIDEHLKFKRLNHIMTHYVLPMADQIKDDGRVHPANLVHGQVTGRRSIKNPPLGTVPKDYTVGDDLARIREAFVPTDDNYVLWEFDYKQIEAWLAWAFSGDPNMLEDLQSGDYHGATAIKALGSPGPCANDCIRHDIKPLCPSCAIHKIKRQHSKKVNYGVQYGETAHGLADPYKGLGTSVEVAQVYIDSILRRYSVYDAWMREQEQVAIRDGELVAPTGAKRRFKLVLDHRSLRQAINFPIQHLASEYTLTSMIELHPKLLELDSYILVENHDSLLIEVSREHEQEAVQLIVETMERPRFPGFPSIKVDAKTGPNWFAMKESAA